MRKIPVRIAKLTPRRRADMLVKLMVIAGLRKAEKIVEQESRNMPVHIDPMENEVLREWHAQAVAKGMATGIAEGRAEGRAEGMRAAKREFLAKQIEKKFGPLPGWALVKLNQWSLAELDDAVTRILDASGLSEFFETK